jgi:hypothetical protein
MGENPPLSDEEIMSIAVQRMLTGTAHGLGSVTVTAEFPVEGPQVP